MTTLTFLSIGETTENISNRRMDRLCGFGILITTFNRE